MRKTIPFTNCARKTAGRRFVTLVTKISGIAESVRGLRFPCANKLLPFKDRASQRGEFHISHDASRLISVFSPRWKERSRVSREIFNDLNFKIQLIQGKFQ